MAKSGNPFLEGFGRGVEAVLHGGADARGPEGPVRPQSAASGLVAGALAALAVSLVRRAGARRAPVRGRSLAKGAVAGAGAAGALLILRFLSIRRTERASDDGNDGNLAGELLEGAGRGLIYAGLLDPYLPGSPPLRGALVGTAHYLAAPLGGLFVRMQEFSPIRRVPVVSTLLDVGTAPDAPFQDFLLEGVLLGLMYGNGPD
ncbi:MAG: hypothetical protein OYK82_10865 [Gammaproteobacteria bacterium]|nr:hypothetical protein [Gammaproteobacteria bacterium]